MDNCLIMLSGGLDSAALLYKLLKESKTQVWAHHIIIINKENRYNIELEACRAIFNYCKKIRSFEYSESTWVFPFNKFICYDADIVAFTAAQIVPNLYKNEKIKVLTGRVQEDDTIQSSVNLLKYTQKLFRSATKRIEHMVVPELLKPIRNLSKKDLINSIPKELLELTFSCRKPIDNKPCNTCKSCKHVKNALKGV